MIGKNWMKVLAGLMVTAGIAVPAISQARTHYLGKTPPSISMMPLVDSTPVKAVKKVVLHKGVMHKGASHLVASHAAVSHHKKLTTAVLHSKHMAVKKHKAIGSKKLAV